MDNKLHPSSVFTLCIFIFLLVFLPLTIIVSLGRTSLFSKAESKMTNPRNIQPNGLLVQKTLTPSPQPKPILKTTPTPTTAPPSFPNYSVISLVLVPSDQTFDLSKLKQIDRVMEYIRYWYAARLNNRTFHLIRTQIVRSEKPLSWFFECHNEVGHCTDQKHHYNSLWELKNLGYPIGPSLAVKQQLVIFFQGSVATYPALGGSEPEGVNATFIAIPQFIDFLDNSDPFSLNINYLCPFGPDCPKLYKIGTITHEIAHTFNLSHHLNLSPECNQSIIDNMSAFPHTGFVQEPCNPEYTTMLNSPFLRSYASTIPPPLSNLAIFRVNLPVGWNFISLPIEPPGFPEQTVFSQTISAIFRSFPMDNCTKIEALDNNGNWIIYNCIPNSQNPVVDLFIGKGFTIKMNSPANLTVYGLKPQQNYSVSLKPGWNLVGPPLPNYNAAPATSFVSIGHNLKTVFGYETTDSNDPWKLFNPTAPPPASDLIQISSGKSYWIEVTGDSIWIPTGNPTYTLEYQSTGAKNYSPPN